MEEGIGLGLERRLVKLFFSDTGAVILKTGKIILVDSNFVHLLNNHGKVEFIPISRIVRMEEL